MDSSENDETTETPTNPSNEPEVEREIDLSEEEGFPPNDRREEPEVVFEPSPAFVEEINMPPDKREQPDEEDDTDSEDVKVVRAVRTGRLKREDVKAQMLAEGGIPRHAEWAVKRTGEPEPVNQRDQLVLDVRQAVEEGGGQIVSDPILPAAPGVYICDIKDPGSPPGFQTLQHGRNDFSGMTHPEELQKLAALVAAGILRKA